MDGVFGALRDAAPDAWGRRVIERIAGRPLDEVDVLLESAPWTLPQSNGRTRIRRHGQQTGAVSIDIIMERRKALEWVLNAEDDWDHVEMST